MERGYKLYWRWLGRTERAFLILLLITLALHLLRAPVGSRLLFDTASVVLGLIVLIRFLRRVFRGAIWRLRNRLIAAYILIAVVPIVLILALTAWASKWIIGQMAVYLVNTQLTFRERTLQRQADALAKEPSGEPLQAVVRMVDIARRSFPAVEALVQGGPTETRYPDSSTLTPPPAVWKRASGLIVKNDGKIDRLFAWGHAVNEDQRVTIVAPITHEVLADLAPEIGAVRIEGDGLSGAPGGRVPVAKNFFDFPIEGYYRTTVPTWNSPDEQRPIFLTVSTRLSAVLGTISLTSDWADFIFLLIATVAGIFFVLELVSLIAGIRLSRTITSAVHELYEGTLRVKEGDFKYRIPVNGADQLADLSSSFNTMTENLGRLIIVSKEKERLESELEIAREVQNQLFPKNAPVTKCLELRGVCNAARMVSGDYYDFMPLSDHALAFAIGDVAGKGISAALLMATIQSTMRTQLSAMTNGNSANISTALMVSNLNRLLYATTAPEKYATFYFAAYEESTSTLTYTNAGHLAPMLLRRGTVQTLDSTGTVVGAFPVARYQEKRIHLETGDLLVAYTDGIVEPENAYGEMFGEERLRDLLLKYACSDSDEIIARTMDAVNQWTGSSELQDDMTMLVARRL
jgi:phosphoserine phosphatase RsbU/P